MKPSDLTTQQARDFVGATVSIRTSINHTTAAHDALVGAIEKDLATNLSTKRAFKAFFAKAHRSTASALTVIADVSHAQATNADPPVAEREFSRADQALELRADESKLPSCPSTSSRAEAALTLWSSQRRATGGASETSTSSRADKALEMRFGARPKDTNQ